MAELENSKDLISVLWSGADILRSKMDANEYKDYLLGNGIKKEQIIEMALDEIDNIKYRNPFELNDYIKNKITKNKK